MLLPKNGDFAGDCYHEPLAMTLETTKLVRFCLFPFLSLQAFLFIRKIKLVYVITVDRINSIDFQDIRACLCLKEDNI